MEPCTCKQIEALLIIIGPTVFLKIIIHTHIFIFVLKLHGGYSYIFVQDARNRTSDIKYMYKSDM